MYGRQNGIVLFCFVLHFISYFLFHMLINEIFHLEVTGQITITYNVT